MPPSELPSTLSAAHHRLDLVASKATALVQGFANVEDPYSTSTDNPWMNPDHIFQELRIARDELAQAWNDLEQEIIALKSTSNDKGKTLDPDRCLALYMDMITDAFADTLEHMRKTEGDSINLEVLVDCLQSGLDLLTSDEQEALFSEALDNEIDGEDAGKKDEEDVSCHELHRRKMGLDVSVSG